MVHQLGDNSPDGMNMGLSATEKIAFYGATPIVKASVTQQATATTGALRSDLDGLLTALSDLGFITLA